MSYLLAAFSWMLLASSALAINLLQMCTLTVRPFSKKLFRQLNLKLAGLFWGLCVFVLTRVQKVEVIISGDELFKGENVVLFCNHQQMPDIMVLMPLAVRCGRLADMKWFAKEQLKMLPGIGWGMMFLDCVFLRRNWSDDADTIRQTFHNLVHYGLPFWLVIFPEGTRITPEKLNRSQDFAKQHGLRVPQRVMIPRTRGFTASMEGLRSRLDAVYDVTIGYDPAIPSLRDLFNGKLRKAHLHVKRFPAAELPNEEKALSQWLIHRFEEKDVLMDRFARTGSFFA